MVSRKKEMESLDWDLHKGESQFIAVYGRRRVGKTYLVRQFFKDDFAFYHTGLQKGNLRDQLVAFRDSLIKYGYAECPPLTSWHDAFGCLEKLISGCASEKKVVFIDELPWMDTPQSKMVMALDRFWNCWASARKDIVLVVCGSATSWIITKIVKDRGGLHNRLTDQIYLRPFSLGECEEYAVELGLSFSREEIAQYYMVFGGVPYYWSLLSPGLSFAQNVDQLVFAQNGRLRLEYSQLFSSLFRRARMHLAVVEALAKRPYGTTREEIAAATMIPQGGNFKVVLEELEQCGFIRGFNEPGKRNKGRQYQLIDNFTLFWNQFAGVKDIGDERRLENSINTPRVNTWKGLAFEKLCLLHVPQIKAKLGIGGVLTGTYAWRHVPDEVYTEGAQIDLLLDRADGIINVCEMKWSSGPYVIDKKRDRELREKVGIFSQVTGTRKGVHLTMITTCGVAHNEYRWTPQSEVTLDDLFKEA